MRGILQMVKLKSSIARPLSLTMLNKMVSYIDFDHSIQVAAWAAIVLGCHLQLCKSNLVPNSVAGFKVAQQLQCHDIHFHHGIVVLLHCGCLSLNPFIEISIQNNSSSSDVLNIQASISISPKYEFK